MPARVVLKVVEGGLKDREFVFSQRTTSIVGRAPNCCPQLPDDRDHQAVSRHHCLLDINPPDIRVRDFGSRNGTFVNGVMIGKRGQRGEPHSASRFAEHDLKQGDEIRVGKTAFRVEIYVPATCCDCFAEIPEEQKPAALVHGSSGEQLYRCQACRELAAHAGRVEPAVAGVKRCAECGRDVSAEVGERRTGWYLCSACKADPLPMVHQLFGSRRSDRRAPAPVQGYEVVEELGRGALGAVYLATREPGGRQMALRVLLPSVAVDEPSKQRFLHEMENAKALKHPNVVQAFDSGCSNGAFFFAEEYCDGGSVAARMRTSGVFSVDEATRIVLEVLDGLQYAHQAEIPWARLGGDRVGPGRGLAHRDIKPHNVFLAGPPEARVAKLADFALAKAFDAAGLGGQTYTGPVAGTPAFMPRQQVIDFNYAQPDVDLWALAATFYFMLTARVPRDAAPGKDPWQTVLDTDPVPIRQRYPSIPRRLAELIDVALCDRGGLCFKTADIFKQALLAVL